MGCGFSGLAGRKLGICGVAWGHSPTARRTLGGGIQMCRIFLAPRRIRANLVGHRWLVLTYRARSRTRLAAAVNPLAAHNVPYLGDSLVRIFPPRCRHSPGGLYLETRALCSSVAPP